MKEGGWWGQQGRQVGARVYSRPVASEADVTATWPPPVGCLACYSSAFYFIFSFWNKDSSAF